jgi:hypothetical protein
MDTPSDSLSEALRRWKVAPPVDAGFRNLRTHAAAWVLVTVVMLGAAAFTGRATAEARVRADREAMVVSYLVDLDPRVQAMLKP